MSVKIGYIHGTGAAINVELGWIPDFVMVTNVTDGDKITFGCTNGSVVAFTSGGTGEIKAGDTIRGLTTTGAYAKIREVILDSGSWAGGDAAGWFIISPEDIHGTFTSENVEVNDSGTNDAAVAAQAEVGVDIDTEVAGTSSNTLITSYVGAGNYGKGFTVGSTVSENAKLLHYVAMRNGPGESVGPRVLGNLQSTVW